MRNRFRIVIPVALIRGQLHHHTGRHKSIMIKPLIQAIDGSSGRIAEVRSLLGLEESVMAQLVAYAIRMGFVKLREDHLGLSSSMLGAIYQGTLDKEIKKMVESQSVDFAIDLVNGRIHDFEWIIKHQKRNELNDDLRIESTVQTIQIPLLINDMNLRELVESSSVNADKAKRLSSYKVEKITDMNIIEVIDVAVNAFEESSKEITRWFLENDTPFSMMECIRSKKPDLFAIKYKLKEAGKSWQQSQAGFLLERIDKLWETFQYAQLKTTENYRRRKLARLALEEVKVWKDMWRDESEPYSDIESCDAWCGTAYFQGKELAKFMQSVKRRVVILSSFLNPRYTQWVSEILSHLPKDVSVLILYGHANAETIDEQLAEVEKYKKELSSQLKRNIKLEVGLTSRRTHEKIVIADSNACMIGSWNVCSSNPNSEHMEVNVSVKSRNIADKLCSILEEETRGTELKFIKALHGSLKHTQGAKPRPLKAYIDHLYTLTDILVKLDSGDVRNWQHWKIQLLGVRDLLWTHFDSPRCKIIQTESLRDALAEQVGSSERTILIASDRVNPYGLDASLRRRLLEKPRLIRILWGMESPEYDLSDDPDAQDELKLAGETLSLMKQNRMTVLTKTEPMLNHSKMVTVDESRIIVSSSNFLARGSEPTAESSREIGIFIESPLLARKLLGQLMLHSEAIRGKVNLRKLAGQPWDLYEITREAVSEVANDKEIKDKGRPDLVSFALKSRFMSITKDGKLADNASDLSLASLSHRWRECASFFDANILAFAQKHLLPHHEEEFFALACEMIGIQRLFNNQEYVILPRSRKTNVLLPKHLRKESSSKHSGDRNAVGMMIEHTFAERVYNFQINRDSIQ